ncbi:hypothetical protein EP331_00120 [bacterium]|nr:MAG: hypothetical protein EP331_00120 [bacterium]
MMFLNRKKFYFYHVRKTGGSTVNYSILAALGNGDELYKKLSRDLSIKIDGKKIVGWNSKKINHESFFYGFSHHPYGNIHLNKHTYSFTVVRDPFDRICSHYKMLKMFTSGNIQHPVLKNEGKWLENGVYSFVELIPDEHLLRQLFMFSKEYSIREAFQNMKTLNRIVPLQQLNNFITAELSEVTQLKLSTTIRNESKYYLSIEEKEVLESLRYKLNPEYELFDKFEITF